jgi:gas vesicle protein
MALMFLLAPESGTATRSLIADKVNDGEGWIKDKSAAAEEYISTQWAGLRDAVKEAAQVIARG